MHQALRPYVTASVALVGAGMIAVIPVAAPTPDIQSVPDVTLAAFELPDFSQIMTDAQTSLSALSTAGQALFSAIADNPAGLFTNWQDLAAATTFLAGDQKSFLGPVSQNSLDQAHNLIFQLLTAPDNPLDPGSGPVVPADILPVVNFLASPLSGVLLGELSPLIAPLVPFLNPFLEVLADLQNGTSPDMGALFTQLLEAPFNSIYGLFAGQTLNLDVLVPLVADSGLLPAGVDISSLSLAFGGLFSPGSTESGIGAVPAFDGGAGGSVFNALGLDILLGGPGGTPLDFPGQGIGPIGAMAGLQDIMAQAIAGTLPPLTPPDTAEAFGDLFNSTSLDQWFSDLFNGTGLDQVFSGLASDLGI